jgi:hypothetical protein
VFATESPSSAFHISRLTEDYFRALGQVIEIGAVLQSHVNGAPCRNDRVSERFRHPETLGLEPQQMASDIEKM